MSSWRDIVLAVVLAFSLIQFPHHARSHGFSEAGGADHDIQVLAGHVAGAHDLISADFHPNQSDDHDAQCGISLACAATGWVGSEPLAVRAPGAIEFMFMRTAQSRPRSVLFTLKPKPPRHSM